MHCAAINNHTDIVEYIIEDLQMKELDKEDLVSTWCSLSINWLCDSQRCLNSSLPVRKPGICSGGRAWVSGNVTTVERHIRSGDYEAQQGMCPFASLHRHAFALTSFLLRKLDASWSLFSPCLLPERGHAPALGRQEWPLGCCWLSAAVLWHSRWSQHGRQPVETLWGLEQCVLGGKPRAVWAAGCHYKPWSGLTGLALQNIVDIYSVLLFTLA